MAAHVEEASLQVQGQDPMPFHNVTKEDERRNTNVLLEYKSVEGRPDAAMTVGFDVAQPQPCIHYGEYASSSVSGTSVAREQDEMRSNRVITFFFLTLSDMITVLIARPLHQQVRVVIQ